MCRRSQPQRPPYFPNYNDVAFVPYGHCLRYHDQLQRKQIGNSSREFLCCSYPFAPNSLWNCTVMWQGEERSVPLAVVRKGISIALGGRRFCSTRFDSAYCTVSHVRCTWWDMYCSTSKKSTTVKNNIQLQYWSTVQNSRIRPTSSPF